MAHLGLPTRQAGERPTASVRPGSSRVTVRRKAHPRAPDDRGLLPNRFLLIVGGTGRSPRDHRELLGLIGTPGP